MRRPVLALAKPGDGEDAWALAMCILSPEGQRVLAEDGSAVAGVPAE